MAKPELGTKRLCAGCGAKFYDLGRTPIVCPKCGTVFEVAAAAPRREAARPQPVAKDEDKSEVETSDVDLVSLEDADDEAAPAKDVGADPDVDVDDDEADDDTFLEDDEDENTDVTDLIGDTPEDDDES